MVSIIIIAIIIVFVFLAPNLLFAFIFNIKNAICYMITDVFKFVKYKENRLYKAGEMIGFVGLFGKGKTLSAVHHVRGIYATHDGAQVFCPRRKKWVNQQVVVYSNVAIKGIDCRPFNTLQDLIDVHDNIQRIDDLNDTLTISLFLLDEAGSELNSRAFKSNIDALVLNSILTCRHSNISMFYTAQRFNHVDALLRQVTQYVYECDKRWRFQFLKKYDAWALEQAQSPSSVPCESISSWFIKDSDFDAYDTYAFVEKLKKDVKAGNMLSEEEILSLRVSQNANVDDVSSVVKKSKRKRYFI